MYKIDLMAVKQFNSSSIYTGSISYKELSKRARLTARTKASEKLYQRPTDTARVREISEFLKKSKNTDSPIFSTPLVLATSTEMYEEPDLKLLHDDDYKPQFNKAILINKTHEDDVSESRFFELYLPDVEDSIFIVDGQHRFLGTKYFFDQEEKKVIIEQENGREYTPDFDDMEFLVTFVLDYTLLEQAAIIANVNFKQKPVNKSIYYDIFGALPDSRNEITFAYQLVNELNYLDAYKNTIKMLGKGSGTISLAFMVETILDNLISQKGNLYKTYHGYENKSSEDYKNLAILFTDYFLYIKEKFNRYFPKKMMALDTLNKFYFTKDFQVTKTELIKNCMNEIEDLNKITIEDFFKRSKTLNNLSEKYVKLESGEQLEDYNKRKLDFFLNKLYTHNYSTPYYNSFQYKRNYLMKATGMYALIRIFNDLYPEMTNIDTSSSAPMFALLDTKFELVLKTPQYFFEDERLQGSGSASLQSLCYKILYSAVIDNKLQNSF